MLAVTAIYQAMLLTRLSLDSLIEDSCHSLIGHGCRYEHLWSQLASGKPKKKIAVSPL